MGMTRVKGLRSTHTPHVVSRHALAHAGQGAVGQVVEQRALPGVEDEELEDRVRDVGPGRGAPLGRGGSRQPEHLGGDAIEEQRVALLIVALQEEDPGHQALLGGHRGVLGRVGERRELLGDGLLGHAEAGEERGEAPAARGRDKRYPRFPNLTWTVGTQAIARQALAPTLAAWLTGRSPRFVKGTASTAVPARF